MITLLPLLLGLSLGCTGAGREFLPGTRFPLLLFRGKSMVLLLGANIPDYFVSLLCFSYSTLYCTLAVISA